MGTIPFGLLAALTAAVVASLMVGSGSGGALIVPRFPGDIAFIRSGQIWVMNADGTGQTELSAELDGARDPAWSPDGSKLAFVSDRDGNDEIYVMDVWREVTRLTNNPASDVQPAWSPDGSQIAFASDRDGNFEIYVMNADGGSQTRLTDNAADDASPKWQPLLVLPGDVNCDDIANSIDAALILQFHARLIDSLPCPENADLNGDGAINSIDALFLLYFRAGLIDSLPP